MHRDNVRKLSDYIDRLNSEKKGRGLRRYNLTDENKIYQTIRQVRRLREPSMPESGYSEDLAKIVAYRMHRQNLIRNARRPWLIRAAIVTAVILLMLGLAVMSPFGKPNLVNAMEQAFDGVKAYHGILRAESINGNGEKTTQFQMEVWADKKGRYYVKQVDGSEQGLVTVNNGTMKWQIRPDEKNVYLFSEFPDPYRFTFEIGSEISDARNALNIKNLGEAVLSGRKTSVLEITPKGGDSYTLWIDQKTSLPLQKVSAINNGIKYQWSYSDISFEDQLPSELMAYTAPEGYQEVDTNPEQVVLNQEEAAKLAGFMPVMPQNIPSGYIFRNIAVETDDKIIKINYQSMDGTIKISVLQGNEVEVFKPVATSVLGRIGDGVIEIQSPVQGEAGVLSGGSYGGVTKISSLRWPENGAEFAVVGNVPSEELIAFASCITDKPIEVPSASTTEFKPQIEVPVDLTVEENEQKSVDAGHSPWKLDPAFVAQVFVSLKISPEGIQGDYPVKYEDLKVAYNSGSEAIIEVGAENSPVSKVYLKRLVRQDSTGIWTVVGYDPAK